MLLKRAVWSEDIHVSATYEVYIRLRIMCSQLIDGGLLTIWMDQSEKYPLIRDIAQTDIKPNRIEIVQ